MKLLSNKQEKRYILGINVSSATFEFISLHTLANGITKTQVIKPLIEDWISQNRISDEDLLQMIIRRVDTQWKIEKRSDPLLMFSTFKINLQKELSGKGLRKEYVDYIIKEIE